MTRRKGTPKRDGSGRGTRANRGRGGCKTTRSKGRGRNRRWMDSFSLYSLMRGKNVWN